MTPKPGTILHMKFVTLQTNQRTRHVTRRVTEVWRDTNGRFRAVLTRGPKGTQEEVGGIWYSSGFIRSPGPTLIYNPATNTIAATSRFAFGDPAAGIRKELADKGARIAGKVVINGRTLERIRGTGLGCPCEILI